MYQLNLLGRAELRKSGELIELSTRKALAILIYISRQPDRRAFRDRLAAMFWEDADDARARVSLRQAVSIIRRDTALPDETDVALLQSEGELVLIGGNLETDVDALERAAAGTDEADWQLVADLYKGDFLEGFTVRGAPAFEDWMVLERQRLRELALTRLGRLMDAALAPGGSTQQGIRTAMRVLALDPMQEQAHRALMRLHARQGRHAAALKQYHGLVETLNRELGVQPELETQQLFRTITEGRRKAGASQPVDAEPETVAILSRPQDTASGSEARDGEAQGNAEPESTIAGAGHRWRDIARSRKAVVLAIPLIGLLVGGAWWRHVRAMDDNPPTIERAYTIYSSDRFHRPAASPDGNWVVMTSRTGNVDLYLKPVSSQPPIRLTTDPAIDTNPAWSPDGASIAFVRSRTVPSEPCQIVVMPIPGGRERVVGRCRHATSSAIAWSADQRSIIFTDQSTQGAAERLHRLEIATGKITELITGEDASASHDEPAISGDGRHVAFLRRASWAASDVRVLDTVTGKVQALTHDSQRIWGLAWSPGDKGLFFSSPRGGDVGLWWVSLADPAKGPQRVSAGLMEFRTVSASRRRARLIIEAFRDRHYFVELPRGSSVARAIPELASGTADWSADAGPAGELAFVSDRSDGSEQLWVAEKGRAPRQLTDISGWTLSEPRWSPDGKTIAFIAAKGEQADLFVVPANGGAPVKLTNDPAEDASPSWAPDGRSIYITTRGDSWRLRRVGFGGSDQSVSVLPLPARAVRVGPDLRLYYVKESGNGIWRRPISGGGREELIVPDLLPLDWMNWAITAEAIYYIRRYGDARSGKIRRVSLSGSGGEDLADTANLLYWVSFTVRPDGTLILTRRDLQIDIMGADLSSR